jgi:hypothetical protein
MNREIKFRAWDKKENQMVGEGLEEFSIGFDGRLRFWHRLKREYYPLDDDFIVMQYTGLTLHGQELYEGDIVENVVGGEKYAIKKDDYHRLADVQAHPDTFIIIGNVYENPELRQEKPALT